MKMVPDNQQVLRNRVLTTSSNVATQARGGFGEELENASIMCIRYLAYVLQSNIVFTAYSEQCTRRTGDGSHDLHRGRPLP
eukprot:6208044-Pleurochrysis_carterae.AAC.1